MMTRNSILKNGEFHEVNEVRMDSKSRITLKQNASIKVFSYKVYRNELGQYLLDPQVTIPAHEAWLFKNSKAKEALQKGIEDAKQGRLVKLREDYSKHADDFS